ncbi:hypothetical protein Tco_0540992 [Tanacetum coccineum]
MVRTVWSSHHDVIDCHLASDTCEWYLHLIIAVIAVPYTLCLLDQCATIKQVKRMGETRIDIIRYTGLVIVHYSGLIIPPGVNIDQGMEEKMNVHFPEEKTDPRRLPGGSRNVVRSEVLKTPTGGKRTGRWRKTDPDLRSNLVSNHLPGSEDLGVFVANSGLSLKGIVGFALKLFRKYSGRCGVRHALKGIRGDSAEAGSSKVVRGRWNFGGTTDRILVTIGFGGSSESLSDCCCQSSMGFEKDSREHAQNRNIK